MMKNRNLRFQELTQYYMRRTKCYRKNYHYILSATPANPNVDIKNYVNYFPTLKVNYNNHLVPINPKEIDSIRLSETEENAIVFDFWSEKKLPIGRELQSLRRISEDLVAFDRSVVLENHMF